MVEINIKDGTNFATLDIAFNKNESVIIQRGSMVSHNGRLKLDGKLNSKKTGLGGVVASVAKSAVSGESMFMTHAFATSDNALLTIAPKVPGTIKRLEIGADEYLLNDGAFLASTSGVKIDIKRQKMTKAIFGGQGGLFVMKATGQGELFINGFGDIYQINLDGTEPYICDNSHVLAWSSGLEYQIEAASGTFGFVTGEGLVNSFEGTGSIFIQSHNLKGFIESASVFNGN